MSATGSTPDFLSEFGLPVIEWNGRFFVESSPLLAAPPFPPGTWEVVQSFPTTQQQNYIAFTSTVADSSPMGIPYSVYVTTAHTTTPSVWFISAPDSGYSVDNIAPGVPQAFAVAYNTGGGNQLSWDTAPEPDFQYFRVYRSTDPGFVPVPGDLVHETASTSWADPIAGGYQYHYKITALDHAGNESDPASVGTATAIDEPPLPKQFALYPNVPNPFNPATVIAYDVPAGGGVVTLQVYDVSGRLVRKLLNGPQAPGRKTVTWAGRDDRGTPLATGVYFYRLTAAGFVETRKMVLLK